MALIRFGRSIVNTNPLLVVVLVIAIWVLIDAKQIGVKKGQISGWGNMGPWGWFAVTLFLCAIGLPLYLIKRGEFKRINRKS
jgi:hypothetical protein